MATSLQGVKSEVEMAPHIWAILRISSISSGCYPLFQDSSTSARVVSLILTEKEREISAMGMNLGGLDVAVASALSTGMSQVAADFLSLSIAFSTEQV